MAVLHVDEKFLDQYAAGTLQADHVAAVEEHLLECELCQSRLVQADQFIALFRAASQSQCWSAKYRPWKLLGPAGLVAAALTLILVPPREQLTAPATVLLRSLRKPDAALSIVFGRPALLVFDPPVLSDSPNYLAKIVDLNGAQVLTRQTAVKEGQPAILIEKLPRGAYWVRLYRQQEGNTPVAEYGLKVE
jgi:hypothetical protein